MRNRTILAALLLLCLAAPPAQAEAVEVEGVTFAGSTRWNGAPLLLNGAGLLRYRIVIKAYVAALYLGEGIAANAALADVPRRLEIEYFWSIDGDDFGRVALEHIRETVDAATFAEIREPLLELNGLYQNVVPGDRYALTYMPGVGTELALNGERKGVVGGAKFAKAIFGLWIGDQPLNESLRDQLLGQ